VADDNAGGTLRLHDHLGERRPDGPGDAFVELLGNDTAHVVGLDEVRQPAEGQRARRRLTSSSTLGGHDAGGL
jgi:hypothetical protein